MDFNEYVATLNSNIKILKGVGDKKSTLFSKLGVNTIWDIIHYFPRSYEDRTKIYSISNAPADVPCCVEAVVARTVLERKIKRNISLYTLKVRDDTGILNIKWFSSPFNKNKLWVGNKYIFYGVISELPSGREMTLKLCEPFDQTEYTGRIVPIYRSTNSLTQKDIIKAVNNALALFDGFVNSIPDEILKQYSLVDKWTSIRQMHNPATQEDYEKARKSLAFEELLTLMLALKKLRTYNEINSNIKISNTACANEFVNKLPFKLTDDQQKAVDTICADFKKSSPMNRLLQGDVGSGKTAVAAAAAFVAVNNGYQVALMAPTEILAKQHHDTFCKMFSEFNINIGLLTGSSKGKKAIYEDLSKGTIDIIIGTHALIEDDVAFANIGLCITDEQHRFGVRQRSKLLKQNEQIHPHTLVMSATPIPRTLSLIVYGDLDISVISTMPSGRKPVKTYFIPSSYKSRMYGFLNKQIENGNQCFVVCPLVEESENMDAKSSIEIQNELQKVFPQYNVALLHGKMSSAEKESTMQDFANKKSQILVATTVIEVGIDVPNANVIVIENAERFGLSQLHQLRGRVGRGSSESHCILISDTKTEESIMRLKTMCSTNNGFEIAAKDLEMRGCGEFFGTRQHGVPELKVANLFTDTQIVNNVNELVDKILASDPELCDDKYKFLKSRIDKVFREHGKIEIFN